MKLPSTLELAVAGGVTAWASNEVSWSPPWLEQGAWTVAFVAGTITLAFGLYDLAMRLKP